MPFPKLIDNRGAVLGLSLGSDVIEIVALIFAIAA